MRFSSLFLAICFLFIFVSSATHARAGHGVSIDGNLKYKKGFTRFDYSSDKAVKGGQLVLHDLGSFDKLNPYTLKGVPPTGIDFFIFETLGVASLDETFSKYGLIARDIEVAVDRLSVTFTIDERARFSDGTKITPEDVKFSLEIMKSKAHPAYQAYFQDIDRAEVLDPQRVRFYFARQNRELHMIACEVPVFSRKFYETHEFDSAEMVAPLGSGPYVLADIKPGKGVTYRRNPDYWAKDHPVRKGMFNYDTIIYKFFQDQIVSVEAFKANLFDFMYVNVAKQWARDLTGPKFDSKMIVKERLKHKNNAGMQGFVFNTRRPLFADRRVRRAIGLSFDFEWANSKLFFNQYTRCTSYFSNSPLAAQGLPEGLELSILEPFRGKVPDEVFTEPLTAVTTTPPDSLRKNLRKAKKLLTDAGWSVKDGILRNSEGTALAFDILLVSPMFERIMAGFAKNLAKLGIAVTYRTVDATLYIDRRKRFDFDMMVNSFGQSLSPGNEQRNYWHSSAADLNGSRNFIGIKDPVVDSLVDKIIYAGSQEELTAATHALDRVLWYGYYVVPNWYVASHRVAYWNKFAKPEKLPLYYSAMDALMTWWVKEGNK